MLTRYDKFQAELDTCFTAGCKSFFLSFTVLQCGERPDKLISLKIGDEVNLVR